MNKVVKHLYTELPATNKKQVYLDFEQSPKMLLYLELLENVKTVSTQKAIATIYKEEREDIEDKVLINRFYKLRSKLHLHLLGQMKDHPNSLTKEEKELIFLRLLVLKNEHYAALKQLKVLEKKCWEDNLFELLPEVINLIKSSMHAHQPNNEEILDYLEKAELAAELLYNLQKFQNYIASFSAHYYTLNNEISLLDYYKSVINKMRRKANAFKEFPRFSLLYHYTAFCIGCQLGEVTSVISNILSRHLNKLRQLMDAYPEMPMDLYGPNHRMFNLDLTYLQESMYWYSKQDAKKSYACILKSKGLRMDNSTVYFRTTEGTLNNIVLCCIASKKHEVTLEYIEMIKEFQIINDSIEADIPYFIYESINYLGLYPSIQHPKPKELIRTCERFLEKGGVETDWMREVVAGFCLLYGFPKEGKVFLEEQQDLESNEMKNLGASLLDLVNFVIEKDQKGIQGFINLLTKLKKETNSRNEVAYLDSLRDIAKHF
jgi:hypothetical protein